MAIHYENTSILLFYWNIYGLHFWKKKFSVLEVFIGYMMLFKNCHSAKSFMYAGIDLCILLILYAFWNKILSFKWKLKTLGLLPKETKQFLQAWAIALLLS